jgi:hypothetical protein
MIKKLSGLFVVFICLFNNVHAQDASKLNVPVSPAFSILDFEPAAVMRPTSAKSLATDVLSSFDKNGKLLLNLGLEVAPYWLKSHPNLSRKTYLNPGVGQAFLQSLSISAGTAKDSASGADKLGAGFRFRLSNGKPVDELAIAEAELSAKNKIILVINNVRSAVGEGDTKQSVTNDIADKLKSELKLDDKVINSIKQRAAALADKFEDTEDGIDNFLKALITDRDDAEIELKKKISELVYDRKGFILEFAGATGYYSDKKKFERFGFWANASYFVSPDDFFTLTARYMHKNNDTSLNNVDVGLGFLKKGASYNISIEGMLRWYRAEIPAFNAGNQPVIILEKNFTYRLAVQGSYSISKDISVNLSIGKDFESPFISSKGVFSILGINYSLFSKEPASLK